MYITAAPVLTCDEAAPPGKGGEHPTGLLLAEYQQRSQGCKYCKYWFGNHLDQLQKKQPYSITFDNIILMSSKRLLTIVKYPHAGIRDMLVEGVQTRAQRGRWTGGTKIKAVKYSAEWKKERK